MWEKSCLREVWERNEMLVVCLSRHQNELCAAWNTVGEISLTGIVALKEKDKDSNEGQ